MSGREFWIGTSWKMTKSVAEAERFAAALAAGWPGHHGPLRLFVIPPYTHLNRVAGALRGSPVLVGAQDTSPWPDGAHTGDVSAAMIAETGAALVEIGHAERRRDHHETDDLVAAKVGAALEHGMRVMLCVGETQAIRDEGRALEHVTGQVRSAFARVRPEDRDRVLVAYEPVWAIGEGSRAATLPEVEPVHAAVRAVLKDLGQADPVVLYGGSVNSGNVDELARSAEVDGLFVGRAAWDPDGFLGLCATAVRALAARPERRWSEDPPYGTPSVGPRRAPAAPRVPGLPDAGRRRLAVQRVLDPSGRMLSLAVDHGPDAWPVAPVPDAAGLARPKADIVAALRDLPSSVLVDVEHGAPACLSRDVVTPSGLIVGLERQTAPTAPVPAERLIANGRDAATVAAAGADAIKLMWVEDLDDAGSAGRFALLERVIADFHAVGLAVMAEVLVAPRDREEPAESLRRRQLDVVAEVARRTPDFLKLAFPAGVDAVAGHAVARAACDDLNAAAGTLPWTILSGGQDFGAVVRQVAVACASGASGFVVGRSLWADLLDTGSALIPGAADVLSARWHELASVTRALAAPVQR
ncbi:triose-phosphate isomerase [Microtetraspora malaysiensis]|uniref:triose-phosphate isomerase n=1 Tax=Microtetraspora malaysiensis TaxID=161358 RepID=UPI00082CAF12|nr:triose-phosphate isomerase [Microtetraspora malaysiensis]